MLLTQQPSTLEKYARFELAIINAPFLHPQSPSSLSNWEMKARPPPKGKALSRSISTDHSDSQIPFYALSFYPDPDYLMDSYMS